jgi:hypothetical protein
MLVSLLIVDAVALGTAGAVAMYLLPLFIAAARRIPGVAAVAVVNVLLGWTFLGWVLALAMALRSEAPAVQVVQNFPAPPPWPDHLAGAGWAGPAGPPLPRPGYPPPLALPPAPDSSWPGADDPESW